MSTVTIRHAPDLTGVPVNIQRELEWLRSYCYKLLDGQQQASTSGSFVQDTFTYRTSKTFPLSKAPIASTVSVYRNGVLLRLGSTQQYILAGQTVTLLQNANVLSGDWIQINYQAQ